MNAKQRYEDLCGSVERAARHLRYCATQYVQNPGDDPQLMRAARSYADAVRALRNEGRRRADRRVLKGRKVSK